MKRSIQFALTLIAVTLLAATASAATAVPSTNTDNVKADVVGSCRWTTASLTLGFGNYDPWNTSATTGSFDINFKCVKKTDPAEAYKISFNKSGGNMLNGANQLAYTLTDAASAALPTSAPGVSPNAGGVPGISGAGFSFTIKGSITQSQDVPVGSYVDTLVATINY